MICEKCGSDNVTLQIINETKLKNKYHGIIWWLLIGWWWIFVKWTVFFGPAILFAIFGHKKQKAVNKQKNIYVCQSCGHRQAA